MQLDHQAFDGIRKEIQDFMRSSETVLCLASMETLTDEEIEIIRCYAQWLSEKSTANRTALGNATTPTSPPD